MQQVLFNYESHLKEIHSQRGYKNHTGNESAVSDTMLFYLFFFIIYICFCTLIFYSKSVK